MAQYLPVTTPRCVEVCHVQCIGIVELEHLQQGPIPILLEFRMKVCTYVYPTQTQYEEREVKDRRDLGFYQNNNNVYHCTILYHCTIYHIPLYHTLTNGHMVTFPHSNLSVQFSLLVSKLQRHHTTYLRSSWQQGAQIH